jgi:hypothetical protein
MALRMCPAVSRRHKGGTAFGQAAVLAPALRASRLSPVKATRCVQATFYAAGVFDLHWHR